MCYSSGEGEISLFMLRLPKDLFSCEYDTLPVIVNQIQTCQPSADWILPVRKLLAECTPLYRTSDSNNSDS